MRRCWILVGCAAAVALTASVSVETGATWRVTDSTGRPLAGAYVACHYEGSEFRVVEPGRYERPGTITRTDGNGTIRFPRRLHVHWPFPLQGAPHLRIGLVYAPDLHAAVANDLSPSQTVPPDIPRHHVDLDRRVIDLADCSNSPEDWSKTLGVLRDFLLTPLFGDDRVQTVVIDAAVTRQLVDAFRAEYFAFLERYAETEREILPPPATDRDWSWLDADVRNGRMLRWEAERRARGTWGRFITFWFEETLADYERQVSRPSR